MFSEHFRPEVPTFSELVRGTVQMTTLAEYYTEGRLKRRIRVTFCSPSVAGGRMFADARDIVKAVALLLIAVILIGTGAATWATPAGVLVFVAGWLLLGWYFLIVVGNQLMYERRQAIKMVESINATPSVVSR